MTLLPTLFIEHCSNITTGCPVSLFENVKCLHFRNGSLATILQHSRSAKEINTVFVYNSTVSSSRYGSHGMCDINIYWGKSLINVVENINVYCTDYNNVKPCSKVKQQMTVSLENRSNFAVSINVFPQIAPENTNHTHFTRPSI